MVEPDVVDRLDGDVGVGIGGQQHARASACSSTAWARNSIPVICGMRWSTMKSADRAAAQRQLADGLQRVVAGVGGHDPVLLPVARAQVALDGAQDGQIVIDGQDDRLGGHGASSLTMPWTHLPDTARASIGP